MISARSRSIESGEAERQRRVFVDVLLQEREAAKLTLEDIREETDNFVFAGAGFQKCYRERA